MSNNVITVVQDTIGRNVSFRDMFSRTKMTRNQLVTKIENNSYNNYHIIITNGVTTTCFATNKSVR